MRTGIKAMRKNGNNILKPDCKTRNLDAPSVLPTVACHHQVCQCRHVSMGRGCRFWPEGKDESPQEIQILLPDSPRSD